MSLACLPLYGLISLLGLTGLPVEAYGNGSAVVLTYHHVDSRTPESTSVSPDQFAEQLDYLIANSYKVWHLPDVIRRLKNGQHLPDKSVAITFDDAYRSVYTAAWPLLRAHNLPFTVFVHTSAIGDSPGLHMSWAQLRELDKAGVEIGNHSHTHDHLPSKSVEEALADLGKAQEILEDKLNVQASTMAYPYGEFTPALVQWVNKQWTGFGQHSGGVGPKNNLAALPRVPISGQYASIEKFAQRINLHPLPLSAEPKNGLVTLIDQPEISLQIPESIPNAQNIRCYASGQGLMDMTLLARTLTIRPKQPISAGRTKFNCTLKATGTGYYWWSFLVMHPPDQNSWYTW
ncbi:MAG: polysaccharide deacetylase family protein [Pseudomonadota bacterium]